MWGRRTIRFSRPTQSREHLYGWAPGGAAAGNPSYTLARTPRFRRKHRGGPRIRGLCTAPAVVGGRFCRNLRIRADPTPHNPLYTQCPRRSGARTPVRQRVPTALILRLRHAHRTGQQTGGRLSDAPHKTTRIQPDPRQENSTNTPPPGPLPRTTSGLHRHYDHSRAQSMPPAVLDGPADPSGAGSRNPQREHRPYPLSPPSECACAPTRPLRP